MWGPVPLILAMYDYFGLAIANIILITFVFAVVSEGLVRRRRRQEIRRLWTLNRPEHNRQWCRARILRWLLVIAKNDYASVVKFEW